MSKALILVWNDFTHDKRVMNIAESLTKFGYSSSVVASKHERGLANKEISIYEIIRIPVFSSLYRKSKQSDEISIDNLDVRKTKKAIQKNVLRKNLVSFFNWLFFNVGMFYQGIIIKPNLIYCNDLNTTTVGYLLHKIFKAKLIFDSHELWLQGHTYQNSTFIRKAYWRFIQKKLFNKFDAVITTTDFRANFLQKEYKRVEVFTIMNCPKFEEYNKTNLLRIEFSIDENATIFLYQGLLSAKRGIYNIIDAIGDIDNATLILMGMGKEIPDIQSYINKQNLTKKCFIKSAVSPEVLISYTSSADVGVQLLLNADLNHYSTISNKVFEYIMSGLAIICSDFPELRKIVVDNDIGIAIKPDDKEAIANSFRKLKNIDLLYKFKSNALKMSKHYNWENEEKKLQKIVNEL